MIHSSTFYEFPKSLEEFGYRFNEEGKLRKIETNERFEFYVNPDDHSYNQRHYEALGEVIGEHIESELVSTYGLQRRVIPVDLEDNENAFKSRIYLSNDASHCQNLLLLIQGSGVVRPGQWARQVIINDSLELGTMFPYIRKAQELNWGIIVFNPNENYGKIIKDGEVIARGPIKGSESSDHHCLYVWEHFVRNSEAKKILIVAHSYGGINTTNLLNELALDFKSRVTAIALTDSVHSASMINTTSRKWFERHALNWIRSHLPINKVIAEAKKFYGCRCCSAGHPKHEYTSGTAFEQVFEFLQYHLEHDSDDRRDNPDVSEEFDKGDMEIDGEDDEKPTESEQSGALTSISTNTPNEMEIDDNNNVKPMESEKKDDEATNDTSTALDEKIVGSDITNYITDPSDDKLSTEREKMNLDATNDASTSRGLAGGNIVENEVPTSVGSPIESTVDSSQIINVGKSSNSELDVALLSPETPDDNQQGISIAKDVSSKESTKSETSLLESVSIGSDPEPFDEATVPERVIAQSSEDNAENLRQNADNVQNTKSDVNDMSPSIDTHNEHIQNRESSSTADQVTNQPEQEVVSNPS